MGRAPDPRLIEYLSAYDPSVCELTLRLRELLLREAPDAVEAIYDAYNAVAIGYSFTGRLKDSFCHIAAYSKHVNLGFNRGATLPDPEGVLMGSGSQVRHVRIATAEDLTRPYLSSYIRAAIEQVGRPEARHDGPRSIVRGNYPTKRRPGKNR